MIDDSDTTLKKKEKTPSELSSLRSAGPHSDAQLQDPQLPETRPAIDSDMHNTEQPDTDRTKSHEKSPQLSKSNEKSTAIASGVKMAAAPPTPEVGEIREFKFDQE